MWQVTWKADPALLALADRHYSRRERGSSLFTPPGETVALITECERAGWVTLRQDHGPNAGQWVNCFFRNESELLSSSLVREAIERTCELWGPLPANGMITYIDWTKVKATTNPGACYRFAGWKRDGISSKGLIRLRFVA